MSQWCLVQVLKSGDSAPPVSPAPTMSGTGIRPELVEDPLMLSDPLVTNPVMSPDMTIEYFEELMKALV